MLPAIIIWTIVSLGAAVFFGLKYIVKKARTNATATILSLENKYEAKNDKGKVETNYKYLVQVNYGDKVANANFYETASKKGESGLKINDTFPVIYNEKANYVEGLIEEGRKFKSSICAFAIGLVASIIGFILTVYVF